MPDTVLLLVVNKQYADDIVASGLSGASGDVGKAGEEAAKKSREAQGYGGGSGVGA